jgi:hypothetical protein
VAYVLNLIKAAAEKMQGDVAKQVKILLLGGCDLFLQVKKIFIDRMIDLCFLWLSICGCT